MEAADKRGADLGFLKAALRVTVEILTVLLAPLVGRTYRIHGLRICVFLDGADNEDVLNAIRDALDLIQANDPISFRRLKRFLPRVLVFEAGLPEYRPTIRAFNLPEGLVRSASSTELAMAFVHEATHGRLYEAGFRGKSATSRGRIEEVCVRREVAFVRRVPDSAVDLENYARQKLRYRWWEDDVHNVRMKRELDKLWGRESGK